MPQDEDQQLLTLELAGDDRKVLAEVLLTFDNPNFGHADLQAAATYWAEVLEGTEPMEAGDVQTVVWLLRDCAAWRKAPISSRDRARYWATYLEGRLSS